MEFTKNSTIYVSGHDGMVGKRLIQYLTENGYSKIITATFQELDLRNQKSVETFFNKYQPEIVIHIAARVGGIYANIKSPAEFIYDNLMIQTNVIHSAYKNKCQKLVFLGSSCIYPKDCIQPMSEDFFMTGKLEPTNQSYAIAKIAGIQMCQSYNKQYNTNFISIMPSNLYGPGDHYNNRNSHVMAALISRFHNAIKEKEEKVIVWGTGNPRREFLFIDDLISAIIFLLKNYNDSSIINVGPGYDISIKKLAEKISRILGYTGLIEFDKTKPDGMMKKLLDVSKINDLGWKTNIDLDEGIRRAYNEYRKIFKE
ncbi:GDP-L-fucose synthase family protein [Promethearchaeum syntrophicum]|uniref:GDP-L-fucose synthase n=1 Tax=Promethearchaeum syntrophicum TaxID=2594042 RepID=A0A5B9DAJ0_9ARCH|nr:GDP-L-fucose synthase [Candidatus Prometheoarchaeum syntrophicum]QEE16021.1 dTDP-glucose 4,6-dehydratase [Candidatus Prometheoarchaeum syntrophicum]